jgi:hypothetical protein
MNSKLSKKYEYHGLSKHPLYATYMAMRHRCYSPKNRMFPRYGGRGIKVCDRWLKSFLEFLNDMGPKPSPEHSINRIDNDGDYCPENCDWATRIEQNRNRINNRFLRFLGRKMCIGEWSKEVGIGRTIIRNRVVALHWTVKQALTTPVIRR